MADAWPSHSEGRHETLDEASLLGTVFESINEALVLIDGDGNLLLHNGAARHVLGREKLTTEPRLWLRRLPAEPTFTYGFHRDSSEEGVRILAVKLATVRYAGAQSIVAIARDVTLEQHRIEELTTFAAVAAHDMKTPLVAVRGWLELAEDLLDQDPVRAREAIERGLRATHRMAREIQDWLTYNVAREGIIAPEPVPLQPVLDTLTGTHPGADIVVDAPDTVMVDATLLQHLLVNLVGNAVKYTRPGETPHVAIRSARSEDAAWVRLEVVDAGIGVPPGEERSIFEPFHRAIGVQDTYEGSGLGLALCRRIVRRHGGAITARSNHGPGTTVTVTLPAAPA